MLTLPPVVSFNYQFYALHQHGRYQMGDLIITEVEVRVAGIVFVVSQIWSVRTATPNHVWSGPRYNRTQRVLQIRTKIFTKPSGNPTNKLVSYQQKVFCCCCYTTWLWPWFYVKHICRSKNYVGNNWEQTLNEAQVRWKSSKKKQMNFL